MQIENFPFSRSFFSAGLENVQREFIKEGKLMCLKAPKVGDGEEKGEKKTTK